jgi:hypothetical protein
VQQSSMVVNTTEYEDEPEVGRHWYDYAGGVSIDWTATADYIVGIVELIIALSWRKLICMNE